MFRLHLKGEMGDVRVALYDPRQSILRWEDTDENIVELGEKITLPSFPSHSPDSPMPKSSDVRTLKIQLGLACNYSCSYCNQSHQVHEASISKLSDAREFLANLEWITEQPKKIEFWGGEPLVYMSKLRILVPALKSRFPGSRMSMITNGSLMNDSIIEFIKEYDIEIGMSHDGPGQQLRGPDPLDSPKTRAAILRLLSEREGKISFNAVLTEHNSDPDLIHDFIASKLGVESIPLELEGVVQAYDGRVRAWSKSAYAALRHNIFNSMVMGRGLHMHSLAGRFSSFVDWLSSGVNLDSMGQKCGMDRPENISIDLLGNVMTCQNTGAEGKHNIGHVARLSDVKLNTSWHWSKRENCSGCPVVRLCGGSCMFLEGENFDVSCENEYHLSMAVLSGILFFLTDRVLIELEGEHRRPKLANYDQLSIPVKMIA